MGFFGKHFLSIDQMSLDEAEALFVLADKLLPVANRKMIFRPLEGAVLGSLFFEASTRTRASFEAAFSRLGGSVCSTTGFTFSSMAKGESIYDTSRVISGYVDILVIRHPDKGSVAEFANTTHVPVINGGDGPGEHPTQALLDLYTIRTEFRRLGKSLAGSHILFVGDLKYGRTVHSLIRLLSLYANLHITLLSPQELPLPTDILDSISYCGNRIDVRHSLPSVDGNVDIIYATRIQKERFSDELIVSYTEDYHVDQRFLSHVGDEHTVLMHPLPRDGATDANDLSVSLNQDPRLAIFRQTDNGIPVRMALFASILGADKQIESQFRPVDWWTPRTIGPDDADFGTM
jgi:aspartate carbamoyltransferase catalytic subunit